MTPLAQVMVRQSVIRALALLQAVGSLGSTANVHRLELVAAIPQTAALAAAGITIAKPLALASGLLPVADATSPSGHVSSDLMSRDPTSQSVFTQ